MPETLTPITITLHSVPLDGGGVDITVTGNIVQDGDTESTTDVHEVISGNAKRDLLRLMANVALIITADKLAAELAEAVGIDPSAPLTQDDGEKLIAHLLALATGGEA